MLLRSFLRLILRPQQLQRRPPGNPHPVWALDMRRALTQLALGNTWPSMAKIGQVLQFLSNFDFSSWIAACLACLPFLPSKVSKARCDFLHVLDQEKKKRTFEDKLQRFEDMWKDVKRTKRCEKTWRAFWILLEVVSEIQSHALQS